MINEVVSVDAGPAIGQLDAFATAAEEAAAKVDAAFKSIKVPSLGGSGAANMARSMDAAAAKMSAAVDKMDASFAKLKATGAEAGAAMAGIGKAGAESAAGLGDAAKGANDAAAAYGRLGKVSRDSAVAMDGQAVATRRAGRSAAESAGFFSKHKELILGTGLALGYSVDKAMKFDASMTLLNTQAGVSVKQMPQLTRGVLELAGQVGQSPGNLAESLFHVESNMSSLGITAPRALQLVKIAAEGASTGHADLVDTTNALTSVVASGIPGVKNYSQAMGVLNATVGSGDMSMQQLADSMASGVVPIVKGYGLNIKDVGAALATFGDLNIRGAQAGTDLRTSVQALAVPAKSGAAELKALGLNANTLSKDMQSGGLLKALDDLQGRFKANGIGAKNMGGVITDLFGKKAGPGLAVLLENMDRLNSKYPELTKNANNFGVAWDKTLQTPQQRLNNLVQGTQALAITAGNVLLPYANKALGGIDTGMQWLQSHALASKGLALGAGALVVGGIGKGLFSGVESSLSGLGKIGSALKIPGLDKLANLGGNGLPAAAADLSGAAGRLSAAAGELGGSAGKLDTASAAQEERAGAGGGGAGAAGGKGSVLGAATIAAVGAWALGHVIGSFLPKANAGQEAAYRKNIPGWLQGPTDFVFGGKAPSLYAHLPSGADLWHDLFGTPKPPPMPAPAPPPKYADGRTFYGEVPRGQPHPANFRASIPVGLPAPIPTYPSGRPFYGEVPRGAAKPAPAPFYGEVPRGLPAPVQSRGPTEMGIAAHAGAQLAVPAVKPIKIPPPDLSAVSAVKARLTAAVSNVPVKPIKLPAPDVSALTAAKGKAQSAGNAITSAITGALGKPVHAKAPDLSAYAGAAGAARADGNNISAGLASGILAGEGAVVAAAHQVAAAAAAAMAVAVQSHSPSKKTQKTGHDMADGLVLGLQGGKDAVDAAAAALGKNAARATDIAAIDAASKKLLTEVPKGDTALTRMLKADNRDLDRMARTRAKLEQEISDSEQVAKSAISGASIMNSLNAVNPAGAEPIASAAIVQGQQYQASSMKQFAQQLTKLQAMGLNATSLSQIAQAGPDQGLGIAQGITSGGKSAIRQLNQLQKQMQSSAAQIGNVAGPAMYQAGKDMGQGLAAGLKSELGSLDKAMEHLAKSMVASIPKHTAAAKKAASRAGASVASGAASGASSAAGSGGGSYGSAAASLSHAGAALSASAAALTAAATALRHDAGGRPGSGHPIAHPVAAGGGTGRIAPGTPAYGGGGHYGTPFHLPGGGGGGTHYHYHVVQNVQGNVHAMTDLASAMADHFVTRSTNNWRSGLVAPGRTV